MSGDSQSTPKPLLRFDGVSKIFRTRGEPERRAVDHVELSVQPGETLAVVGESGSGKSTIVRLGLGLLLPDEGTVRFDGSDWSHISVPERRRLRATAGVVFQEPFEALDPRLRVVDIVAEPLRVHERSLQRSERRDRALRALEQVGMNASALDKLPAQLSGGQQQRVGIARAVIMRPRLVFLDEPTSALDLSVQAQVLALLLDLRAELGVSYVLVTHDLDVAGYLAERVVVMQRGRVVETGSTDAVLTAPTSPYTRNLLAARLDGPARDTGLSPEPV